MSRISVLRACAGDGAPSLSIHFDAFISAMYPDMTAGEYTAP